MKNNINLSTLSPDLQKAIKTEVQAMKSRSSLQPSLAYINAIIEELFDYIDQHSRRYGGVDYVAFNQKVYFSYPELEDYKNKIEEEDFDLLVDQIIESTLLYTFESTAKEAQAKWEKLTGYDLNITVEGRSNGWFCIEASDIVSPFDLEDFRNVSIEYVKENDITDKDLQLRAEFAKKALKFLKEQEQTIKDTVKRLEKTLPEDIKVGVKEFITHNLKV